MLSSRPLFFHAKTGRHPMVSFLLILFSFFFPSVSAADTHGPEKDTLPPVQSLGKIVVTAHGTEGPKGIAIDPMSTSVVLDSYTSPGSPRTVKDVLESIPGVDIQRSDASLSNDKDVVKIRGMGARRIMVRIEGRPVRNAGGFNDRMVDWNSLTLENIERVEVVRGAHSAVYGEAIGETVNIVTQKKGRQKGRTPKVTAMADYSSFETSYLRGNVSGSVKSLGYSIGAGYFAGAFKKQFGTTPGKYLSEAREEPPIRTWESFRKKPLNVPCFLSMSLTPRGTWKRLKSGDRFCWYLKYRTS